MQRHKLTQREARRFILRKQGLIGNRRFTGTEGAYEYIAQAGSIQYDPLDICGRNAELVLHSRVARFRKEQLEALLYKERRLTDCYDKCLCICPAEDWAYFARRRAWYREHPYSEHADPATRERVLGFMRNSPPCRSADIAAQLGLEHAGDILDSLYLMGDIAVEHKKGTVKFFAPAERVLPPGAFREDPNSDYSEYRAWLLKRRIGSVGMLWNRPSDAFLGISDFTAVDREAAFSRLAERGDISLCEVEGISAPLYILSEDEELLEEAVSTRYSPRLEFLAPIDNMLWDRKLIEALFGFRYRWEVYVPSDRREYGYYVLPVLWGEELAGRIEPVADRRSGRLTVKNLWWETGVKRPGDARTARALDALAAFNGVSREY